MTRVCVLVILCGALAAGCRESPAPDGKPLVLRYSSQTDATARDYDELWKKALDSIGIRLTMAAGVAASISNW